MPSRCYYLQDWAYSYIIPLPLPLLYILRQLPVIEKTVLRRLARCSCVKTAGRVVFEENFKKTLNTMPELSINGSN